MWAAPRSAAAAAVAREGSGPGRTGPGWSRSGGRRHRRPRERATQRRTEPPPSPLRPGPGGCAAPSRCLRRRSRSRSGHRAGEARRGEAGRGAAGGPGGGRGGGSFWGPIGPRPGPAPSAAFSSSPSLCRLCLRLHPSWDVGLHSLGRIPRPGTAPRRPHLPTLSSLCSRGAVPRCSASHGPYGFTLLALLTVLSAVSMTPLPCPQSLGSSQQPPYLLPHPWTVPGSPSHSPVPSSPVMLILHLSLSGVPPLILSPLVPSVPLCPLPHFSAPVPITPHRSPTLLSTWAPTFLRTPGLHLAQVHINTYMCICHDELPATWVHPPPHTHITGPTLSYTHSR